MQEDSPIYSVAASAYVSAEARRCLAKWWWAVLVPPVALAIAGAYDIRFFYLCLMVSLIVYPMALSMMWMPWFSASCKACVFISIEAIMESSDFSPAGKE